MATPEEVNESVSNSFFTRVGNIPTIAVVRDTASKSYNYAKERNSFVNKTFSTVEQTAQTAVGHTKPVFDKISGPVNYVDGIASKGLQRVEEILPFVKKHPGEIVTDAKTMVQGTITSAKDFSTQKFQKVKDLGNKVIPAGPYDTGVTFDKSCESLRSSALGVMSAADYYLNLLLPPVSEGDSSESKKDEAQTSEQLKNQREKARNRLIEKTTQHFETLKKHSTEKMEDMSTSVKLLQHVRERGITAFDELTSASILAEMKASFLQQIKDDKKFHKKQDLQFRSLNLTRSASYHVNDMLATSFSIFSYFPSQVRDKYLAALKQSSELSTKIATLPQMEQNKGKNIEEIRKETQNLQATLQQLSTEVIDKLKSSSSFIFSNGSGRGFRR